MKALPATYSICFSACEGFGSKGRAATIYDIETGDTVMAGGCGETDLEAVLETLIGYDYTFDQAFDACSDVLRGATRVLYYYCEAN